MDDKQCTWKDNYPWILCIDVNTVGQHEPKECPASTMNCMLYWHVILQPQWQCSITLAERVQIWCTAGDFIHPVCYFKCAD